MPRRARWTYVKGIDHETRYWFHAASFVVNIKMHIFFIAQLYPRKLKFEVKAGIWNTRHCTNIVCEDNSVPLQQPFDIKPYHVVN